MSRVDWLFAVGSMALRGHCDNLQAGGPLEYTKGRSEVEATFLEHLPCIERISAFVARKHGLSGVDLEDFGSIVKVKLIENDYSVLRKFRAESSLPTYLAVVIAGIFRDYQFQRWGRWRASAIARGYGPVAVRLETLIYRDGHSPDAAIEMLKTLGPPFLSDREIRELLSKLPRRERMRPLEVDSSSLTVIETPHFEAPDPVADDERGRIESALNEVIVSLDAEDRLLLKMKFWEGIGVAEISRTLNLPQKQLYRRLEKLSVEMRKRLQNAGVTNEDANAIVAR